MPLVVCGAPIGNPRDASPRFAAALAGADVVAAEDTRRFRRLAAALEVTVAARVVSYFEGNERARAQELLAELAADRTVVLVTDSGMPTVSDPGYRLVAAAAAAGHLVTVVPGPSAVTAALAVSGLPSDRVAFEGFLPRRAGERRARLAELSEERRTMVFLESPHRLAATLADLAEAFGGERPAVLARELTKTYEEVVRGNLAEIVSAARERTLRGEITLVVGGGQPLVVLYDDLLLAERVRAEEAAGSSRREALSAVAARAGVARRVVYDAVIAAKGGREAH
ncbi:MAG: 16S rRNA (cytidine(1402)-2'-O)-methyltransferase [Mycobacteriales bacterium]